MNLYSNKIRWKIFLAVIAIIIVGISLWYSNYIANKVQKEERHKVQLWSEAIKKKAELVKITNKAFDQIKQQETQNILLWIEAFKTFNRDLNDYTLPAYIIAQYKNLPKIQTDNNGTPVRFSLPFTKEELGDSIFNDTVQSLIADWKSNNQFIITDYLPNQKLYLYYGESKVFTEIKQKRDELIKSFNNDLLDNTALVPLIYADSNNNVLASNLDSNILADSILLNQRVKEMLSENKAIEVSLSDNNIGYIYFNQSNTLKQLKYYPLVQFIVIGLFLLIAYLLFSTFKRAEQNQVWAGMAKETAHQLGTPLSSLMAWTELLDAQGVEKSIITEMNRDIVRLNTVTDRFSKIGSEIALKPENIYEVTDEIVEYLQTRISKRVNLTLDGNKDILTNINKPLYQWVIENITKNAIDAMQGEGDININISQAKEKTIIDIQDTGKGIPLSKFKSVFKPGYSTKERGWGLGLSLVKRIIEEFHEGKVFIKSSEIGKGTVFRIILK